MFTGGSNAAWERYGKVDPYFGVYSTEKYKTENLDEGVLGEFFQSGEAYVDFVLKTVRERIDGDFQPTRALDFGCGVGRLTIPLSRACSHVTGVDVSRHVLDEARKNLRDGAVENVDLIKSDDRLSNVPGTFDFVASFVVFQHIPPRRGRTILKSIVDRLDAGGVGALHFTYHREAPRVRHVVHWARKYVPLANNVVNLIQKKPFLYPLMQWNNYDLNAIFLLLQEQGCGHLYVRFTNHSGHLGVIIFFQKKPLPSM